MKIAIDARWIFAETSGIGQHTRQLIRGLSTLKTPHEWLLLFDDPARMEEVTAETGCAWETALLPYGLFSVRNQLQLFGHLRKAGVQVYHSTNYMMPLLPFPRFRPGAIRGVITIHDLIPLLFRDHAPRSRKNQFFPVYRQLMIEVAARADAIITVSQASKNDILEHLRLPERAKDKIHVVYNGIDPKFRPDAGVLRKHPPEILYVGRLDPYKNVPQLIGAFGECRRQLPEGTRLRLIGPPDARYPEAMDLARKLELFPYLDWEGHVDDATLLEAYRRAAVVVLASAYEGFGLPVAEAMACGTPVICSRASSLPEVGGDAAVYVQPGDLHGLAQALTDLMQDTDTRRRLAAAGPAQVKRFTMDAMARETLRVYASLHPDTHHPPDQEKPV